MVPTSLGMSVIDLFGEEQQNDSPSHVVKPAIRNKMEHEVKLIASGDFDKEDFLRTNLAW